MPKVVLGLKMQSAASKKEKPAAVYVNELFVFPREFLVAKTLMMVAILLSVRMHAAPMYQCSRSKKKLKPNRFVKSFQSTTRKKRNSRVRQCSSALQRQ